jgi:hypothetical protein
VGGKPEVRPPELLGLEELLTRLGWTGRDLEHHLALHRNTVTNWRRQRTPVPKVVLLYLRLLLRTYESRANARPRAGYAIARNRQNVR